MAEVAARLGRLVPERMEQAAIPGVQLAIVRDAATAWNGAFGVANAATKAPVTEASVFEAASLSKPVFAYAVLRLVDAGRLDLDTPIATYLPGPYDVADDERLGRITARHVLSHETGFPNWRPGNQPLRIHFTPGERFSYSGEGVVYLAGRRGTDHGRDARRVHEASVFDPLGMRSSSYVWQARHETLKVHTHGPIGNLAGRRQPWRANAAASLHTTARDYATFVAPSSTDAGSGPPPRGSWARPRAGWTKPASTPPRRRPPAGWRRRWTWGLGWGLEQDGDDWWLWHWGDNGPTKAYVVASPARKTGLVVFLNSENGLTIVPALLREALGLDSTTFAWLKQQPLTPAFTRFVRASAGRGRPARSPTIANHARRCRTTHRSVRTRSTA